ncbi:FecR family protein [Pseudoxanthomonas broegbernensis]|nr:FecR family protein [Pseudoxanthomonas broegbernensis]MBB6064579.1 transmembrane sensor [Pseudoxanthomonas broegbernensis]
MNSGAIPPEVRTAAQQWFVRLQSAQGGDAQRDAFERWRDADPAHAAAYRAVESVWQRSAAMVQDPALSDVLHRARRLPPEPSLLRSAFPALATAACLMLAVGIGYRLWWMPEQVPAVAHATALGEQRTVQLDDGSTVVLDTQSELQVRYGRRERGLVLQQGQADFQVQADPRRPFVVRVGDATVTATGTQFQVRLAEDASAVTLLEGEVVVAGRGGEGDRVTLQAGERIAILSGGGLGPRERLAETDLASARGWTEGTLVVREWPLARLLAEMNRYTESPLRLADPGLAGLEISGSFKPSDQQSFLLSLEYGWPIEVDRSVPDEIVLRRK